MTFSGRPSSSVSPVAPQLRSWLITPRTSGILAGAADDANSTLGQPTSVLDALNALEGDELPTSLGDDALNVPAVPGSDTTPEATTDTPAAPGSDPALAVPDILFARPAGLVGTTLGFTAFVVTSPFTAMAECVDEAWDTLVITPGEWTFTRSLGDFE